MNMDTGLETKFARFGEGLQVQDGAVIEGYASLFGACDQGGDVVAKGAYAASLKALGQGPVAGQCGKGPRGGVADRGGGH